MRPLIVTIDGPAGAGKTTVSRMLAERLGFRYIDTGALYRAVAYEAVSAGVSEGDDDELAALCKHLNLSLSESESGLRLISNGVDITDRIRTPEITMLASTLSARPVIRRFLLELQRDLGRGNNVVVEGRDMGTVVFPEADVKIFLDADAEIRAERRYLETKDPSGRDLTAIRRDMLRRDENDRTRTLAPLRPAPEAVILDSSEMSVEAVVDRMIRIVDTARMVKP